MTKNVKLKKKINLTNPKLPKAEYKGRISEWPTKLVDFISLVVSKNNVIHKKKK